MFFFDFFEFVGGIVNCFLLVDWCEGVVFLVVDYWLFEMGCQELCIVKKILVVVVFQIQLVLVGDVVGGFCVNDFIVVDNQFKFVICFVVGVYVCDFFYQ